MTLRWVAETLAGILLAVWLLAGGHLCPALLLLGTMWAAGREAGP